jgi:prolyl-tRNA synthetase
MQLERFSRFFAPTLKEDPAEASVPSHRLLVRAGFIRQLGAGIYSLLPLAVRTLGKIETIVREEMARTGAQELQLPALLPAEVWRAAAGRRGHHPALRWLWLRGQSRGGSLQRRPRGGSASRAAGALPDSGRADHRSAGGAAVRGRTRVAI